MGRSSCRFCVFESLFFQWLLTCFLYLEDLLSAANPAIMKKTISGLFWPHIFYPHPW